MEFKIYTDGACSGNPGPGGWGAVIFDKENNQKNISGKEKNTTNNRMELFAAIMGLKKIRNNSVNIYYTHILFVKSTFEPPSSAGMVVTTSKGIGW